MLPSYQAAVASHGKHLRPVTARVVHMLVLEEETKDLVPYDAKATIIQVILSSFFSYYIFYYNYSGLRYFIYMCISV